MIKFAVQIFGSQVFPSIIKGPDDGEYDLDMCAPLLTQRHSEFSIPVTADVSMDKRDQFRPNVRRLALLRV